jgi:Ca2+-dependent lipid-binding protein
MPSLVKIRVLEGRDLAPAAAADRSAQVDNSTRDYHVDIRLGTERQRTQTIRKTHDPYWNEEFRFEIVDDSILQNCPVEFKVPIIVT